MVPNPVTAMKNMPSLDPKGIITVEDMAEKDTIKLYREDKYWNLDLKEEFLHETTTLWRTTHADKHNGRLFQTCEARHSPDLELAMRKIDSELVEAVRRHGTISYSKDHIDEFYDKIQQKKNELSKNL